MSNTIPRIIQIKSDLPHKPPYLTRGKLNRGIIKAFQKIKKLRSPSYWFQKVYDNALIYGYKAGTTHEDWTIEGKKKIASYLHYLKFVIDKAMEHNWNNPNHRFKTYELDDIAETLELMYKLDPNVHGTISHIFQITLHYKYVQDDQAPNLFQFENYINLYEALCDVLHACYWANYTHENRIQKKLA